MSKKQAIAFFEEISKNQQLAKEVEKVVDGKNSDEAKVKELISLAKRHNFIFTQEDAKNAQGALKTKLSPEEMLEVSGGKLNLKSSLMAAAMLLGLGSGGATLHSMEASAMKRSAQHQNNGKRPKIDPPNTTQQGDHLFVEAIMRYVQGRSAETNETQQQTTPQPVGGQQQTAPQTCELTNLTQRQTTPSNDQGAAQSNSQQTTRGTPHSRPRTTSGEERHAPKPPPEKKKARPNRERDNETAKRYSGVDGCGYHQVDWSRRLSASGALPAADWPAAPSADLEAEKEICRFCGKKLEPRGKNKLDVKCANAGCIYNWVFPPTGNKHLKGNQRGQLDFGHYARWALLPALILDSRYTYINSTGKQGGSRKRELTIETPAEAWAVWQLIVGHHDGWVDVTNMMVNYGVDDDVIGEVLGLLEESYDNLVLGNESFIDLGSEVQQLVAGHNTGWQQVRTTMARRGYSPDLAIELLENSYNMLTDEQLQGTDYNPTQIPRHPEAALAEIDAAHRRFGIAMQQIEEARRQTREEARRQAIEALQGGEQLTFEQKKRIAKLVAGAGLVTCRAKSAPGGKGCGSSNVHLNARPRGDNIQFKCNDCGKTFSYQPAELLDMLQAAAPGNAPMGLVPAERTVPQLQMVPEIQPMRMTPGNGPTFALNFNSSTMPQIGMQGMNQFNPVQQIMMQQNVLDMEDDDFNIYAYDDDENDNPNVPREEKERREDYVNPEPYVPGPGEMGYQEAQQQMQMMNPNGFNFGGQDMNQFNPMQQFQTFNTVNNANDTLQNGGQYQQYGGDQFENQMNLPQPQIAPENGQFDFGSFGNTPANPPQMNFPNMNQVNVTRQPVPEQMPNMGQLNEIQQQLPSEQPIWQTYNDSGNQFYMNQMNGQPQGMQNMDQINTQFAQNQQTMNEHPEQMAAQPQRNSNANGFFWRFNAEDTEDGSFSPGSWKTWGNQ